MTKSVASQASARTVLPAHPLMLDGTFNASYFRELQAIYEARTGYSLVLSDMNGSIQMGLPDCDKFPCMRSCRECREQIVTEALRTGKVCIDTCHEGYILWGLPFAVNGKTLGGLVVIGGEQEDIQNQANFGKACGALYELMRDRNILPDTDMPDFPDLSHVHRFVYREAFTQVNDELDLHGKPMFTCMQTAEFTSAKKHFEAIQKAFLEAGELPLDLIRGFVGDLIYQAKQQFISDGMDPYACYSEAGVLLEKVAKARSKKQILGVLDSFFQRFIRLSSQRTKDPDDLLIEKATTYLEQHIREVLTRESVAKAVGISPSHFSRLIREKKGRTFTDLLNQYRIEQASKLLVRSTKTLAEIANDSGFCDQSYFSKVFRKYKAMSPAKYRDQHHL